MSSPNIVADTLNAPADIVTAASMSPRHTTMYSQSDRSYYWSAAVAFALAIAIVALVLSVILWYKADKAQKAANCLCKRLNSFACRGSSFMGQWGISSDVMSGTNDGAEMLFSVAGDYQGATASVIPAPWAGQLTALTLESQQIPILGSITATVTINGVEQATMTTTISTGADAPLSVLVLRTPIVIAKDAQIGVNYSFETLELDDDSNVLTAQVWVNWLDEVCSSSSSSSPVLPCASNCAKPCCRPRCR